MKFYRPHISTDRGALLVCLSIPLILAAVAFIIAVSLTGFGLPTPGTPRSIVAALAYVYLALGLIWLPAYGVGCIWYWWASRDEEKVLPRLYVMPLIAAMFIWFPSFVFIEVPLSERMRMYPAFAITAIITGYLWVGVVRLIFYVWRRN